MSRSVIIATGFALALILPFAWKPLHVDDTYFVAWARAMLTDPPFGTTVAFNWVGWEAPLALTSLMNPPAWSGLLALGGLLGAGTEILHLAQVPFLALYLVCMQVLATRHDAGTGSILLLAGFSPLAWVPATTLMPDLAATSLGVLAVLLALKKSVPRTACGLALFAAGSMKYSAASAFILAFLSVPLTALLAGLLTLIWPAADFLVTRMNGIALDEFGTHMEHRWQASLALRFFMAKGAYSWATLAACAVFPGIFWVLGLSQFRRHVRTTLLAFGCIIAGAVFLWLAGAWKAGALPGGPMSAVKSTFNAAWFLGAMAGMTLWLFRLWLAGNRRDRLDSRPLLIWIGIVWCVACLAPAHPAARYSMLALPPLLVLIIRDIKRTLPARIRMTVTAALVVSTAWLGLNLVRADWQFARCSRNLVQEAWRGFGLENRRVYTTGHWGIQDAVTSLGGSVLDVRRTKLAAGDVILLPISGNRHYLTEAFDVPRKMLGLVSCGAALPGIRSIQPEFSAGFYGGKIWLPYAFVYGCRPEQASPERLMVVEILGPNAR